MAMRYHINPETGRVNQCKAAPGNCRFKAEETGDEASHYETKDAARAAYEAANEHHELSKLSKTTPTGRPRKKRKERRISGVLGEITAHLNVNEFRAMPIDAQVRTLAEAYGYTRSLPEKFTLQEIAPDIRQHVNRSVESGDLVKTTSGRLAIFYKSSYSSPYYSLLDPLTGEIVRNETYRLLKIRGITLRYRAGKLKAKRKVPSFDTQKELQKLDPYYESRKRELDAEAARVNAIEAAHAARRDEEYERRKAEQAVESAEAYKRQESRRATDEALKAKKVKPVEEAKPKAEKTEGSSVQQETTRIEEEQPPRGIFGRLSRFFRQS